MRTRIGVPGVVDRWAQPVVSRLGFEMRVRHAAQPAFTGSPHGRHTLNGYLAMG